MSENEDREKVAVVGMSGAFPGARDIGELWDLLREKRDGITTLSKDELAASGESPELLADPRYVPRGGFLDGAEEFDHEFFGYSPGEALNIDPQQRLFLTHSRLALEDAGQPPEALQVPVGVFAGESPTQYWFLLRSGPMTKGLDDFKTMLGNEKDFLATRTSYKLNLKGPSLDIQSACSTSLASVGLACQSLLTWNCDLALAGGVSVSAPRKRGFVASEGMILSPKGECRPFDADADGTLFGEGVGVVCLKRLSEALADGDFVYAVIDAVAMNNDGSDKVSFTAPSANGQADVIEMAQLLAGVSPDEVGYIETHGTATLLGDPIEVHALTQAFRKSTERRSFCHLGSIKANIGHLDACAGIASFIKTVLVVHTGIIPGQRNFDRPNPHLDFGSSPFLVSPTEVRWAPGPGPRIAGVSSFGIGGTNVHAVLRSPPASQPGRAGQGLVLRLGAKTSAALADYAGKVQGWLAAHPEVSVESLLSKVSKAQTAQPWRKGFAGRNRDELLQALSQPWDGGVFAADGPVVFTFPGQGAQFSGMAKAYYGHLTEFTKWIDQGLALAERWGIPRLREYLLEEGHDAAVDQTETAQPLLFLVEYALAQELIGRGVRPDVLVGHSIGEYAAAAVGGALSFEDGLRLVWKRGYWMQRAPHGAMVAVSGDPDSIRTWSRTGVSASVFNTAAQVVYSGTLEAVDLLEQEMNRSGQEFKRLKTSHGFHSPLMDGILASYSAEVENVRFQPLQIPLVSNLDGAWLSGSVDWKDYWIRQLRNPVRFDLCLAALADRPSSKVVEVGPGRALTGFFRRTFPDHGALFGALPSAKVQAPQFETLLLSLWEVGLEFRTAFPPVNQSELILFSGYPFAKTRFWPRSTESRQASALPAAPRSEGPARDRIRAVWASVLGHEEFDDETSFFLCGADSFAGIQLVQKLKVQAGLDLTMAEVMSTPTVTGLAARLAAPAVSGGASLSPYLMPAQLQGSGPPLFLVAGAHQTAWKTPDDLSRDTENDFYRYFSNLIPNLGADQPLYWFRPKGFSPLGPLHTTVNIMAETYIAAMKEVQPQGPYHLGGECVGGVVAHEMACRLRARGETVHSLFLLDTPRPSPWVSFREDFWRLADTARWIFRDHLDTVRRQGPVALYKKLWLWMPFALCFFFPVTKWARYQRFCFNHNRIYQRILLRHRAKPYDGPASLIVNRTWNRKNFLLGWARQLGPHLEVHEVPGAHHNRLIVSGKLVGRIIQETMARSLGRRSGAE